MTCFQGEEEWIEEMSELFDRDKKGLISDVEELKLGMNNILFRKYDRDGDGLISAEELTKLIDNKPGEPLDDDLDLDGDGMVNFENLPG